MGVSHLEGVALGALLLELLVRLHDLPHLVLNQHVGGPAVAVDPVVEVPGPDSHVVLRGDVFLRGREEPLDDPRVVGVALRHLMRSRVMALRTATTGCSRPP